ncbi:MAG: ribbon-helix-helix protein, CopG family [Alphaproteobacteria bacterium]|nr:ribbon-helix-helix protein, CopG family [Alphaproteobacteria bacterium]
MQKDVTISARIPKSLAQKIEKLSKYNKRSKSWLVENAIGSYVNHELSYIEAVEEGMRDIRAGRVHSHEEVVTRLKKKRKKLS